MKNPSPRESLWLLIADQFLDTETTYWLPDIVSFALQHNFSYPECAKIWKYEVCSLLYPNMFCVAGEWAGWDEEWLITELHKIKRRNQGILKWFYRLRYYLFFHFALNIKLKDFKRLFDHVRSQPESDRQEHLRQLENLAYVYFFANDTPANLIQFNPLALELYGKTFFKIFAQAIKITPKKQRQNGHEAIQRYFLKNKPSAAL